MTDRKRIIMKMRYAAYSTAGYIRDINEDNLYIQGSTKSIHRANYRKTGTVKDEPGLFAVCDGLGGEGNGEKAAAVAVECLKEFQESFAESYQEYLEKANREICIRQHEKEKMGCTVAALLLQEKKAFALNLGDSRVYHIRKNVMTQLTQDHSEFEVMRKYGLLKEEDYYTSNLRNSLTRHLGNDEEEAYLAPFIAPEIEVEENDMFLLCSDGLCGVLRKEQMLEYICQKASLRKCCVDLVKASLGAGSEDNVTAVLVACSFR